MSDITRSEAIKTLKEHLSHWERLLQEHICEEQEGIDTISSLKLAIASLETDEAYQLEYERTTKSDLGVDFKLKDYVSREAVRRIIKSPRTQEQMLNALNSLRNATECKAEDCINRDYTAKYVEEFANNEYVSQDEAETIYFIADGIRHIPSVLPDVHDNNVGELTIHCKDCKFFEYDHFEDVFGVPLIVAHEVCTKWGDACKTNENGACFLAERKESEEV